MHYASNTSFLFYISHQFAPHTHKFLSTEAVTYTVFLAFEDISVTKCVWASLMVLIHRCSLISNTRIDLSSEVLMMYLPDGCRSTDRTQFSCDEKVIKHMPWTASHNRTVLSLDPEARYPNSSPPTWALLEEDEIAPAT